MSNQIQYYIQDDGSEKGPYSLGQMRMMWGNGVINLATPYRTEGMDVWCPLSDISELLEPTRGYQAAGRAYPTIVEVRKSRGLYVILGLFLGCLGIHNFYASRYTT